MPDGADALAEPRQVGVHVGLPDHVVAHPEEGVLLPSPFSLRKLASASSSVSIVVARNQLTNTVASPTCGDPCFRSRSHTASPSPSGWPSLASSAHLMIQYTGSSSR